MSQFNITLLKKIRITTVFNNGRTKWISTRYKYDDKLVFPVLLALIKEKKDVIAFIEFDKYFEFISIYIDYNWEVSTKEITAHLDDISNSLYDNFVINDLIIDPVMMIGNYLIMQNSSYDIVRSVNQNEYIDNIIYDNLDQLTKIDDVQKLIIQNIKYNINDSSFNIHDLTGLLNEYTNLKVAQQS